MGKKCKTLKIKIKKRNENKFKRNCPSIVGTSKK